MAQISTERMAGPRLDAVPKLTRFHYSLMPVLMLGYWFEFANVASLGLVMPIIAGNWGLKSEAVGFVLAAVSWGMIAGAYTGGMVADLFGRRRVFMWSLAMYSIFTFVIPFATDMYQLMVVRVLGGWGMGAMTDSITTYITEYYPSRIRGKMTAVIFGFGAGLGSGFGASVVYRSLGITWGWQWLFYFLGGTAVTVYILYLLFLPESARWLQVRGRWDEAERILEKIESQIHPHLMDQYRRDVSTYAARVPSVAQEKEKMSMRDILGPMYRRRTAVLWQYYFFMMGTAWPLNMWVPSVMISAYGAELGSTIMMVIYLGSFFGNMIAVAICERLGRKNTMVLGLAFAGAMMIVFGQVLQSALLAAVMGMLYQVGIGVQVAQGYAYAQELFPTRARASAFASGTGMGRIGMSVFPIVFGMLMSTVGASWVLTLSGVLALISIGIVAVFGVSTKGKTLEELSR
jgi:putative MFS transporter